MKFDGGLTLIRSSVFGEIQCTDQSTGLVMNGQSIVTDQQDSGLVKQLGSRGHHEQADYGNIIMAKLTAGHKTV